MTLTVLPYGREAVLIEVGSLDEVLALHADLIRQPPLGMIETVPAARTLLVRFDPRQTGAASLMSDVQGREPQQWQPVSSDRVEIPIEYDGEDLPAVSDLTGLTVDEVIRRHSAASYTVAFLGLAPGFYFLAGLDPRLRVPRRSSPRTRVSRGAVALAGEFCGIYPRTGPGGWQLIGYTDADLWDLTRHPSAGLGPGTTVNFVPA